MGSSFFPKRVFVFLPSIGHMDQVRRFAFRLLSSAIVNPGCVDMSMTDQIGNLRHIGPLVE